jgi:hypothetical protein
MEQALLLALKPAKRAHAAGEFDYIGGAGFKNMEQRNERAWDKAREHLANHPSNEPDPAKAFRQLEDMYREEPLPEDEVLVFQSGEFQTLDDSVYDLRATLRWLAIRQSIRQKAQKGRSPKLGESAWRNQDRTAHEHGSSYWHLDPAFRISFYRAARSLVKRGLLIACDPVEKGREIRFVSMRKDVAEQYE